MMKQMMKTNCGDKSNEIDDLNTEADMKNWVNQNPQCKPSLDSPPLGFSQGDHAAAHASAVFQKASLQGAAFR